MELGDSSADGRWDDLLEAYLDESLCEEAVERAEALLSSQREARSRLLSILTFRGLAEWTLGGPSTPGSPGCSPFRDAFAAYRAGHLDPTSVASLSRHLHECTACQTAYRSHESVPVRRRIPRGALAAFGCLLLGAAVLATTTLLSPDAPPVDLSAAALVETALDWPASPLDDAACDDLGRVLPTYVTANEGDRFGAVVAIYDRYDGFLRDLLSSPAIQRLRAAWNPEMLDEAQLTELACMLMALREERVPESKRNGAVAALRARTRFITAVLVETTPLATVLNDVALSATSDSFLSALAQLRWAISATNERDVADLNAYLTIARTRSLSNALRFSVQTLIEGGDPGAVRVAFDLIDGPNCTIGWEHVARLASTLVAQRGDAAAAVQKRASQPAISRARALCAFSLLLDASRNGDAEGEASWTAVLRLMVGSEDPQIQGPVVVGLSRKATELDRPALEILARSPHEDVKRRAQAALGRLRRSSED